MRPYSVSERDLSDNGKRERHVLRRTLRTDRTGFVGSMMIRSLCRRETIMSLADKFSDLSARLSVEYFSLALSIRSSRKAGVNPRRRFEEKVARCGACVLDHFPWLSILSAWAAACLLPLCRGVGIFSVLPIACYLLNNKPPRSLAWLQKSSCRPAEIVEVVRKEHSAVVNKNLPCYGLLAAPLFGRAFVLL
jgi:hypothetical protein